MISGTSYRRDPVSELFDTGARQLLARAYGRPGEWVGTRLADPGPRHTSWASGEGIDVLGPDNVITKSGKHMNARSRWARAFVRAIHYQNRWYSSGDGTLRTGKRMTPAPAGSVQVEVGRRLPALGIFPPGRAVRIRIRAGGEQARKAVRQLPEDDRIFTTDGAPAGRWSNPTERDWR